MERVIIELGERPLLDHEAQVPLHLCELDVLALLIEVPLVGHPFVVLVPVAVSWMEHAVMVIRAAQPIVLVFGLYFRLPEVVGAYHTKNMQEIDSNDS